MTFRSYKGDMLPNTAPLERSLWERLVDFFWGVPWRAEPRVNLFALDTAIADLRRVLVDIDSDDKRELDEALDKLEAGIREDATAGSNG